MPLRFHPYLIGFSFILPLDLAFSCAFFYLMKKVQLLVGSAVGIATLQGYPFLGEQGAGAVAGTARDCVLGMRENTLHPC